MAAGLQDPLKANFPRRTAWLSQVHLDLTWVRLSKRAAWLFSVRQLVI